MRGTHHELRSHRAAVISGTFLRPASYYRVGNFGRSPSLAHTDNSVTGTRETRSDAQDSLESAVLFSKKNKPAKSADSHSLNRKAPAACGQKNAAQEMIVSDRSPHKVPALCVSRPSHKRVELSMACLKLSTGRLLRRAPPPMLDAALFSRRHSPKAVMLLPDIAAAPPPNAEMRR